MSLKSIKTSHLLSVSTIAVAVALVATPVSFDSAKFSFDLAKAEAKSGGGSSNGGGGGSSNGGSSSSSSSSNGGGGGSSNGGGKGNSGNSGAGGVSANSNSGNQKNVNSSGSKGDNHGAIASALGALNAAHASETALNNAASNSRVGRIATYLEAHQTTVSILADLEGAITDAEAPLNDAIAAELTVDGGLSEEDIAAATEDYLNAVADAKTAFEESDQAADKQLALDEAIAEATDTLADTLAGENVDVEGGVVTALSDLADEVLDAEKALADAQEEDGSLGIATEEEAAALELAANKEVTPEVTEAVLDLLEGKTIETVTP